MEHTTTIHSTEDFLRWLDAGHATHAELLDLCAIGFVSSREATEPHRQILAALPIGGDHYRLATALSRRIAALLTDFPRLDFPFPGEDETPVGLQYEVLALAAALDCPEVLGGPLQACDAALRAAQIVLPLSVRGAFTEALTRQQLANSPLRARWLSMARGENDALLGGSPEVGMQGLFMLPAADADAAGHPGVDRAALGEGLLAYASVCESDIKTRRQRFRRMVARIRAVWDLNSVYFIRLAHDFQWVEKGHAWAVDALPELFVEDLGEFGPKNEHCWLVWHWFVRALEPWGVIEPVGKDNELCGGHVRLVRFSDAQSGLCSMMFKDFQRLAKSQVEIPENEANAYVERFILVAVEAARKAHKGKIAAALTETREAFARETQLTVAT